MSLPERKHKQHDYPENPYCPACIEEARDKEWARWILEQSNGLTFTVNVKAGTPQIYKVVELPQEDYEALKKLIEG